MKYLITMLFTLMLLLGGCGGTSDYNKQIDDCFALSYWATNYPVQSRGVMGCNTSAKACVNACKALDSACISYGELVINYCTSLPEYKDSHK